VRRSYKLAPSILSADFARLGDEVRAVEAAGADLIHFDVMDGHFVPNISIGVPVLQSLRAVTKLPLDVHLMIEHPERYIEAFVKAGADSISVHVEACSDVLAVVNLIRQFGARTSAAVNPETDVREALHIADKLDMILVMSVHPGFGGQEFIPEALNKLRYVREELERRGLELDLEVDGGIKVDNVAAAAAAGANILVSGSGIFSAPSYTEVITQMRQRLAAVERLTS
jgi:ribulose-phosphate 3-epimerase